MSATNERRLITLLYYQLGSFAVSSIRTQGWAATVAQVVITTVLGLGCLMAIEMIWGRADA